MTGRSPAARTLVALGAACLLTTALFHLRDFRKDSLSVAELGAHMQAVFRAMHLLVGWQWIFVALIVLLAGFAETQLRRVLLLFCGVAIAVEAGLTLALMGVFLGTELMGLAAILIISGGLMSRSQA